MKSPQTSNPNTNRPKWVRSKDSTVVKGKKKRCSYTNDECQRKIINYIVLYACVCVSVVDICILWIMVLHLMWPGYLSFSRSNVYVWVRVLAIYLSLYTQTTATDSPELNKNECQINYIERVAKLSSWCTLYKYYHVEYNCTLNDFLFEAGGMGNGGFVSP